VPGAQLVHELFDELLTFASHEFLAHAEFSGAVVPVEAPVADCDDDREWLDSGLGEAVSPPCAWCRIVAAQQAGGDKLLEPVGQDVGRDAFDRACLQLSRK
jgi:hypothetical protein